MFYTYIETKLAKVVNRIIKHKSKWRIYSYLIKKTDLKGQVFLNS